MKHETSPIRYVFILTAIGLTIPLLMFLIFPSKTYIIYFEIPIFKENLIFSTFILSYLLVFSYLTFGIYIPTALTYFSSKVLLSKSTTWTLKSGKFYDMCKELSVEMGLKTPNIFLSKEPVAYSFGVKENNATIVIFEKCMTLDEQSAKAIILHELAHIKWDIKYHSLHNIYERNYGRYALFDFGFIAVYLWFLVRFVQVVILNSGTSEPVLFFNNLFPFSIAIASAATVLATKKILQMFTLSFRKPVSEIDEFRADLIAYIKLNNAEPFHNALKFLRKHQVNFSLNQQIQKGFKQGLIAKAKDSYNKVFNKGIYAKKYSNWLEYFKEDYGKLNVTFGAGFDYPVDRLRKEFLEFIDDMCKQHISFEINRQITIEQRISQLSKALIITTGKVALSEWLKEVYEIPRENRKKVTEYLTNHLNNFNAMECSDSTQVTAYEVIVIILTLLVKGSLTTKDHL